MKIMALKVDSKSAAMVHRSLEAGEGRFGWSYIDDADLVRLRKKIDTEGWSSLTEDEQNCYQDFLLQLEPDDYVVYINVPRWGECTAARVKSPYYWQRDDTDFNHRFKVSPETVTTFHRNDAAVEPALSARLKLQGRWWRIYAEEEFTRLLDRIEAGDLGEESTPQRRLQLLAKELTPILLGVTEKVQWTHPNYDLEQLLELVLSANPDIKRVERRGGPHDHGADLVVETERPHPLTGRVEQTTYLIQVKSFTGTHSDLRAAVDIRRAFESYRDAAEGIILSTAREAAPELESEIDKVRQETGKAVHLLIGEEVAAFILRHGWQLLREEIQPVTA